MKMVHWRLPPAYESRFVTHLDASLEIEFPEHRMCEVYQHIRQHLDFLINQSMETATKPEPKDDQAP